MTKTRTESVGVIGSGPASLSFAYQMARRGYPVTVYERRDFPGGMLRHAIPDYRLPRDVLDAEIGRVFDMNVALVTGVEIGRDMSLEDLRERHTLLFLGLGAQAGRRLGVEGEKGPGVVLGIDYLTQRKQGVRRDLGARVVVVGGGNTAMDAARSARRDGAEVMVLYRRGREEMPASEPEVADAEAEGIRFEFLSAPLRVLRNGTALAGLEVQRMQLGLRDADGRQRPEPVPGDTYVLEADTVLVAVSQEPGWRGVDGDGPGGKWLHTTSDGKLAEDLWAGGDDRGPGIASRAIAQGRLAAEAAHAQLRGEPTPEPWTSRPAVDPAAIKADYYRDLCRSPASPPSSRRVADQPGVRDRPDPDQRAGLQRGRALHVLRIVLRLPPVLHVLQCRRLHADPAGRTRAVLRARARSLRRLWKVHRALSLRLHGVTGRHRLVMPWSAVRTEQQPCTNEG